MNKKEIYEMLLKVIEPENILCDEPMSKHTTLKIGGNADFYVIANTIEKIRYIVLESRKNNIPLTIVGNGSNLLVLDGGIRGITLRIQLKEITVENNIITAEAGAILSLVSKKALDNELTGIEFAHGIPGTIGGAIRMNAGAHGGEMKDIVVSTTYIDEDGNIETINNEQHNFKYRYSIFHDKNYIILKTVLKLNKGNKKEIQEKLREYSNFRIEKQPLEFPNAGSTFKRNENIIAAKAIDECGLKGYTIGGAKVSIKHAGFIVNKGNATAQDVLDLVEHIKQKVYEKFNEKIELEIVVVGETKNN